MCSDSDLCLFTNTSSKYPAFLETLDGVLDGAPSRDSIILLGYFTIPIHEFFNLHLWQNFLCILTPSGDNEPVTVGVAENKEDAIADQSREKIYYLLHQHREREYQDRDISPKNRGR